MTDLIFQLVYFGVAAAVAVAILSFVVLPIFAILAASAIGIVLVALGIAALLVILFAGGALIADPKPLLYVIGFGATVTAFALVGRTEDTKIKVAAMIAFAVIAAIAVFVERGLAYALGLTAVWVGIGTLWGGFWYIDKVGRARPRQTLKLAKRIVVGTALAIVSTTAAIPYVNDNIASWLLLGALPYLAALLIIAVMGTLQAFNASSG